jgi:hypothetical protein
LNCLEEGKKFLKLSDENVIFFPIFAIFAKVEVQKLKFAPVKAFSMPFFGLNYVNRTWNYHQNI